MCIMCIFKRLRPLETSKLSHLFWRRVHKIVLYILLVKEKCYNHLEMFSNLKDNYCILFSLEL